MSLSIGPANWSTVRRGRREAPGLLPGAGEDERGSRVDVEPLRLPGGRVQLPADRAAGRGLEGPRDVHAGGPRDATQVCVRHIAAVLRSLVSVDEVGELPQPVLETGGGRHPRRPLGVGADEGEVPEHQPQLAAPDVALDERGEHCLRVLAAEGALEVGELGEGYGRVRVAQGNAVLRNVAEERSRLGSAANCAAGGPAGLADRDGDRHDQHRRDDRGGQDALLRARHADAGSLPRMSTG